MVAVRLVCFLGGVRGGCSFIGFGVVGGWGGGKIEEVQACAKIFG